MTQERKELIKIIFDRWEKFDDGETEVYKDAEELFSKLTDDMIDYMHTIFIVRGVNTSYIEDIVDILETIIKFNNISVFAGLDVDKYNRKIQQLKKNADELADFTCSDIELTFPKHPSSIYYEFAYTLEMLYEAENIDDLLSIIEDSFGFKATRGNKYTAPMVKDILSMVSEDTYTEDDNGDEFCLATEELLGHKVKAVNPLHANNYGGSVQYIDDDEE